MAVPQPELLPAGKRLAEGESALSIVLGDRIVPYVLRRSRRRTIALSIDHRGLRVGAPPRALLRDVESLLLRHHHWVVEKLDEWRSRQRPEPLAVVDGLRFPLLDGECLVRIACGSNRAVWALRASDRADVLEESVVTLCLRSPADAGRVLEKALRERARELFQGRLAHYAALLDEPIPPLSLSSARTRWGSCSRRSGIRLNWRLIHFPRQIIDYVVAHEVAHLREMNHSPRFWSIVGQLYADYRQARTALRDRKSTRLNSSHH